MTKRSIDLEALLSEAQIPAMPQSAIRLLAFNNEAEINPVAFAAPIEADPGMTGQVLRFVNSSYFGFAREVSSIKLGISLVGARTVKNFVLWSAVFSLVPNPNCGVFDLQTLWKDSLNRALFARRFSKLLKSKEAEEAFAAALLQDMGVPLLVKALPDDYAALLEERQSTGRRLSDLETERFGWTHADAAASVARRWNLPAGLTLAVAKHTDSDALHADELPAPLQSAVTLSSLLPALRDDEWNDRSAFENAYHAIAPAGAPEPAEFLTQVDEDYREFAPSMKIAGVSKSLARFYPEALSLA